MYRHNFFSSSIIVFAITIGIKVVAFFKQVVIGSYLGANGATDIYYVSYEFIASVVFVLFSSLAISFVPLYQKAAKRSNQDANRLASSVIFLFGLFAVMMVTLVFAFSDQISLILIGRNQSISSNGMSYALRILSGIIFFGCLNTILGSMLEARFVFTYTNSFGLVLSGALISAVVLLSGKFGVDSLIFGTLIAYIIQTLILFITAKRKTHFSIVRPKRRSELRILLLSALPLMIGNGVYQFGNLVDKMIAARVGAGVASSLAYAQTITDGVCALTITSIVSVLFSYAAKLIVDRKSDRLELLISSSVKILLVICIPFSVLLFFFSDPLVAVIYGRGAFGDSAINWTSFAIKGYALGMPFLVFREVFSRVHYAHQDTKTPLVNGAVAIVVHLPLSIGLSGSLGILGITLGSSAAFAVSGYWMMRSSRKYFSSELSKNRVFYAKAALATLVSCVLTAAAVTLVSTFAALAISVLALGLSFVVCLFSDIKEAVKIQMSFKDRWE